MITKIKDYLNQNFQEDISLTLLFENELMHRESVRLLFKKIIGLSPLEYLTQIRLMKAKNLLQKTKIKLEVIAEQTGFRKYVNFRRSFEKKIWYEPGRIP